MKNIIICFILSFILPINIAQANSSSKSKPISIQKPSSIKLNIRNRTQGYKNIKERRNKSDNTKNNILTKNNGEDNHNRAKISPKFAKKVAEARKRRAARIKNSDLQSITE